MAALDDDIRRRRERGRRAQAAYRERQAEATQAMMVQNGLLKDGINKLADATRGDERPELLNAILHLMKTAGIEPQCSKQLETTECAVDNDALINVAPNDSSYTAGYDMENRSGPLHLETTLPQRIIGNVWLDPLYYMSISLPPEDILPYLGHGSKTFAGLLFWSIMSHFQSGCGQKHAEPSVMIQKSLSHSDTMKDITIPFVVSMVEARLEYKKMGTISPQNAAAGEADLGMVLHGQVSREYQIKGRDPTQWLTCASIEVRVRKMFGEHTFGLLGNALSGNERSSLQNLISRMICELYDSAVCFGDGPRWNIDIVDKIFLGIIGEVLVSGLS